MLKLRSLVAAAAFLAVGFAPAVAQSPLRPPGEMLRYGLENGRAAQAVATLTPLASAQAEARLALGFGQFALAVERLAQGLHRFGLQAPRNAFLPVVRLPVPLNPAPEPVDYAKLRAVYQAFLDDVATARTTLVAAAASTTPADQSKLVLDLNAIRFDFTGKAGTTQQMTLGDIVATLGGRGGGGRHTPWIVAFDRADALWLAGYAHIVSALVEFTMAHDWQKTFDATAHLFFTGARASREFVAPAQADPRDWLLYEGGGIADQLAFLHLVQWPAGDRTRMRAVHGHLKAAVALSRDTWKAVLAETDDDREWLPSPAQTNRAIPGLPITDDMVKAWLGVLDEFDAALDGRKLLGHWRFTKGIDLRMVFEQPKPFDLVLWITGHGVTPFLKDGPVLGNATMQQWNGMFRNNFLGYAFFIN